MERLAGPGWIDRPVGIVVDTVAAAVVGRQVVGIVVGLVGVRLPVNTEAGKQFEAAQLVVWLVVLPVEQLVAGKLAVAEYPAEGLAARLVAVDIVVVGSSFLLSYFLLCARLLWIKLQQNNLCC